MRRFTLCYLVVRASFIGMKCTQTTLSSLTQHQSSKFNIVCDTFGTGCKPQLFPNDQGAGMLPQGLIAQRTYLFLSVTQGALEGGRTEPTTRPRRSSNQPVRPLAL